MGLSVFGPGGLLPAEMARKTRAEQPSGALGEGSYFPVAIGDERVGPVGLETTTHGLKDPFNPLKDWGGRRLGPVDEEEFHPEQLV